uniref:Uncharacterized protein n=1 Tax=Cacopsylla melanoneura TaxID=428564 RepID=A0A8D9EQQ5_9HEMI
MKRKQRPLRELNQRPRENKTSARTHRPCSKWFFIGSSVPASHFGLQCVRTQEQSNSTLFRPQQSGPHMRSVFLVTRSRYITSVWTRHYDSVEVPSTNPIFFSFSLQFLFSCY